MNLADLYKKHDEDLESFNRLRQKVWDDMKIKHNNIISAFQSAENLPADQAKKIKNELDDYSKKWAMGTGVKYKAMIAQHKSQIEFITKPKIKKDSEPKTPIEQKRAEFIATMKAIQKQQEQTKPKH